MVKPMKKTRNNTHTAPLTSPGQATHTFAASAPQLTSGPYAPR